MRIWNDLKAIFLLKVNPQSWFLAEVYLLAYQLRYQFSGVPTWNIQPLRTKLIDGVIWVLHVCQTHLSSSHGSHYIFTKWKWENLHKSSANVLPLDMEWTRGRMMDFCETFVALNWASWKCDTLLQTYTFRVGKHIRVSKHIVDLDGAESNLMILHPQQQIPEYPGYQSA